MSPERVRHRTGRSGSGWAPGHRLNRGCGGEHSRWSTAAWRRASIAARHGECGRGGRRGRRRARGRRRRVSAGAGVRFGLHVDHDRGAAVHPPGRAGLLCACRVRARPRLRPCGSAARPRSGSGRNGVRSRLPGVRVPVGDGRSSADRARRSSLGRARVHARGSRVNPVVLASTWVAYSGSGLTLEMTVARFTVGLALAAIVGILLRKAVPPLALESPEHTHEHAHEHDGGRVSAVAAHVGSDFVYMGKFLVAGASVAAAMQTLVPPARVSRSRSGAGREARAPVLRCVQALVRAGAARRCGAVDPGGCSAVPGGGGVSLTPRLARATGPWCGRASSQRCGSAGIATAISARERCG